MPAPGDQHKAAGAITANPFEEERPHISEYTAVELATLQSRLNKRLGPEYISTRPGPGNQKIAYLSAEKAINLANEVFGFNGWSSSIQSIQVDYVDDNVQTGKVSLGLSVVVRVTLKDGTYHEDIGYGGIDNCKGKAMAFEKSKKEATTDALKRALRNFGNVLGNCIYDKDYITKVSKVKAGPAMKFDVNDLHRHADWTVKKEDDTKPALQLAPAGLDSTTVSHSTDLDESFDMGEFDDVDIDEHEFSRPDEIVLLADPAAHQNSVQRAIPGNLRTPSKPPQNRPPNERATTTGQLPNSNRPNAANSNMTNTTYAALPSNRATVQPANHDSSSPGVPPQQFVPHPGAPAPLPGQPPMGRPAGFYSAKAAQNVDQNNVTNLPPTAAKFNPHAESPSIRKTAGVDHNRSVPVKRDNVQPNTASSPKDIVDPRADMNRRIGMPGQPSPLAPRPTKSTSAYRPPTRHGNAGPVATIPGPNGAAPNTVDRNLPTAKRPPLGDVSNMQHNITAATSDGVDAKRQKVSGPVSNAATPPQGQPPTAQP